MGESGRTCRPVDRRGKLEDEPFTVKATRDKVLVEFRGRLVRTLVGRDADEVRRAIDAGDEAALQLLVARKTGNFKRGNER
ncbi:MAG: hypothetical protein M4D80_39325 [Myxococcota bacterium]|nr:hypothetical protein [Myxococcota bacterium]